MRTIWALALLAFWLVPHQAAADTNILLIVDGSNSMWGQIDQKAKMETARETLGKLVSDLPTEVNLGLMVYGHTRKRDCDDVKLLSPIAQNQSKTITSLINAIQPRGKTPIANALAKSRNAFKGREGQNNHILLVSDGIESCDGDPCAAANQLRADGLDISAHVIGFGVSKAEGRKLVCIAENTGGKYFDVANATAFNEAIKAVTVIAKAEPKLEPVKVPEPVVWFEDNFDGDDLADHWEVINPNPDAYIVENGVLTVLTSGTESLIGTDKVENIFRLTKGMPGGDWVATMRIIPEVATFRERYMLSLYKDNENMLLASSGNFIDCCDNLQYRANVQLWGTKVRKGKATSFSSRILRSSGIDRKFDTALKRYFGWTAANVKAVVMRIEKRGRSYVVSAKIEGDLTMPDGKEAPWNQVQELTSLRSPGDSLAIALSQAPYAGNKNYQVNGGEALMSVDWVKIEVPVKAE